MRFPILAPTLSLALCLAAAPVVAETLSAEIGRTGLAPTAARLAAIGEPTDADRFGLAGVRFLGAVEAALQLRWKVGLTDTLAMVPFLRLPLPENPAATGLQPDVIATLFRDVSTAMDDARAPLADIAATSDFGVEVSLGDLWFDINANATRDPGEDLLDVLGPMILGWRWMDRDPATPAPVIRFDAADAAWLSAYTHLLGGISDVILAYDPTASIEKVRAATAAMADLRAAPPSPDYFGFEDGVDVAAMVLGALNQRPDPRRATSAHVHLLAMIADNRSFWQRVEAETDNDREWLPNDRQQSALGIPVPAGTGATWLAVLSDAEALLNGTLLAPYWRLGETSGVNVGRMFTNPAPIDLVGWIQGADALPYMEKGTLVSTQSWDAFAGLMEGQAMLFSLYLN